MQKGKISIFCMTIRFSLCVGALKQEFRRAKPYLFYTFFAKGLM